MFDSDEITCYHEAGHAFMAVRLGGWVQEVTVDPDNDDRPARTGDLSVQWPPAQLKLSVEREVSVALAGPVAEMIYTGEPFHPATVAEWSADWSAAWQVAEDMLSDHARRMAYLEEVTRLIHRQFSNDRIWSAIAALADELSAHERLEGADVAEIVTTWMR
ncbi:hypothetical protein [Stratiformator vulcanicus]|uniref:ATP-dependent zinc metalloprotease FtsH n=1 Tax=Stratiformator vulcanicus TaxID=2527980 RepID=A0A517QWX0_9PLAN|nr:hypothetical protein [Stratiformator vulcanicus]QDT36159.1 hypothetical protein Pan189_05140 [Stratiformator vulcanicus]